MKSVETITAKIYLGLREGYTNKVHTINEVKNFLQDYVDKTSFCVTITPTTFVYKNGRENGVIIGLINYPRFPKTKKELKRRAEEIAKLCKEEYKQNRISIEYPDKTIMLE
ncbi:hypothetical protein HYT91_02705 [Candidatus Pacearchaeota archaeon]|nr:hypothetical protein [Candidatus Pacearchaeota archaeon]